MAKKGLWANIHAKRKRIKAGSGERMRKKGAEGAPTEEQIKNSQEMGGKRKLMKKAGFPDLSGDGKITKKDILMGRGVIGKKKKQTGGMKKIAKAALDAATTGIPGAISNMVTGDTKAATSAAAGPAVAAAKAVKKKAKKKMYGGTKSKKKMMGGKQSKAMYEKGGFLSEPSVFNLDKD